MSPREELCALGAWTVQLHRRLVHLHLVYRGCMHFVVLFLWQETIKGTMAVMYNWKILETIYRIRKNS